MNYEKHYKALISRAIGRPIEGYTELHHILPRCLGGGNEKSNLVRLTAEEHYTAHLLLIRIYTNEPKMVYAATMMTVTNGKHGRSNNKMYGWLRKAAAEAHSNRAVTIEQREAQSKMRTGQKRSPEACKNISKSLKGRVFTQEWKDAISASKKGKPSKLKGVPLAESVKEKISATLKSKPFESRIFGRTYSEETKAKIGAASKGRKRIVKHEGAIHAHQIDSSRITRRVR